MNTEPDLPGPLERAERAREEKHFWRKVYCVVLLIFLCFVGSIALFVWQPMICGLILALAALAALLTFFIYSIGKCPRCFNKMERHKTHPNAYVCTKCSYLRVYE